MSRKKCMQILILYNFIQPILRKNPCEWNAVEVVGAYKNHSGEIFIQRWLVYRRQINIKILWFTYNASKYA